MFQKFSSALVWVKIGSSGRVGLLTLTIFGDWTRCIFRRAHSPSPPWKVSGDLLKRLVREYTAVKILEAVTNDGFFWILFPLGMMYTSAVVICAAAGLILLRDSMTSVACLFLAQVTILIIVGMFILCRLITNAFKLVFAHSPVAERHRARTLTLCTKTSEVTSARGASVRFLLPDGSTHDFDVNVFQYGANCVCRNFLQERNHFSIIT